MMPYIVARARIQPDTQADSIVAAYAMQLRNGVVPDLSGNGNDGTPVGNPRQRSGLLSDFIFFDGANDYIDLDSDIVFSGEYTISTLYSKDNGTAMLVGASATNSKIGFNSGNYFVRAADSGASDQTVPADQDQEYFMFTVTRDAANKVDLYINDDDPIRLFGDAAQVGDATFNRFARDDGSVYHSGTLHNVIFSNKAESANWVSEQYALGKRALFKTNPVENYSGTGQFIGRSPLRKDSGSFDIVDDTINGENAKVVETVGAVSYENVPTSLFQQSPKESARGGFIRSIYVPSGQTCQWMFVATEVGSVGSAGQNGYKLIINSDGSYNVQKVTAGATANLFFNSAAGIIPVDAWNEIEFVFDDELALYVNGSLAAVSSGTNPIAESTFTESLYQITRTTTGVKQSLGSESGNHSIIKRLLP